MALDLAGGFARSNYVLAAGDDKDKSDSEKNDLTHRYFPPSTAKRVTRDNSERSCRLTQRTDLPNLQFGNTRHCN
jgi:hypothetical protein